MGALALLLLAVANTADPVPPPAPAASPVTVTATPSRSEVSIGEPFVLEVKATGPSGTTFTFPGEAVTDAFELRPSPDAEGVSPAPGSGVRRYEATVFSLDDVTIPPVPVRYRLPDGTEGEAASEPLALEVSSLLPRDPQEQKLADIRGPRPVGIGRAFWIALVVLLALLAALATWLVRRRRRVEEAPPAPVPALPPDVEALRALDELAASGLLIRGEYRPFYIRLTEVAKRYLGRRLGAPVPEMTSAETIAFLREHAHGAEALPAVRDLAGAADRIKFARGEGLAAEAERHLAAVRGLVPALETRLRPAEPPAASEGKAA